MRVDAPPNFAADYCMEISGVATAWVSAFHLAVRIMRITGSYISSHYWALWAKRLDGDTIPWELLVSETIDTVHEILLSS
jgi:hypothetical protein